jgi:hypothetical protein
MKAITIWQPWAQLIVQGIKKFETRSWKTNYRGKIAIHAGKSNACKNTGNLDPSTYYAIGEALGFATWDDTNIERCLNSLPSGFIIATADLVECWSTNGDRWIQSGNLSKQVSATERTFGDFSPGRWAWELLNVKMLDKPIPAKGMQGLWNWED